MPESNPRQNHDANGSSNQPHCSAMLHAMVRHCHCRKGFKCALPLTNEGPVAALFARPGTLEPGSVLIRMLGHYPE
jgi:hypothetical protein